MQRYLKRTSLFSIVLWAVSGSAWAQVTIDDLFKNGPIKIHTKSDLEISRLGKVGVIQGNSAIAVHQALAIINSMRDHINAKLTCDNQKLPYSASITQFNTQSDDTSLTLSASTYVSQCSRGVWGTLKGVAEDVHGTMVISVQLEPSVNSSGIIQFKQPTVTIPSYDLAALHGLYTVKQKDIDDVIRELSPEIKNGVATLNNLLAKAFSNAAIQTAVKAYNVRILKVQLAAMGGDLIFRFGHSNQFALPDSGGQWGF